MSFSAQSSNPDVAALSAALAWWRDAGVDCSFADEATSWLAAPEPQQADAAPVYTPPKAPAPPPKPLFGGDPAAWPQDMAALQDWWLREPSLDSGLTEGRVAPRGPVGAAMMVLVEAPEADDRETLLSGPLGRLQAAILAAMGIDPAQAYVASVLPRHMPYADWADLAERGLPELTRHHVALAQPRRLILFGRNVSSLLGHDPAKSDDTSTTITHSHGAVPALIAPALEDLVGRPKVKARLWQALLRWHRD